MIRKKQRKSSKRTSAAGARTRAIARAQRKKRDAAMSTEERLGLLWALRLVVHADDIGLAVAPQRLPEPVRTLFDARGAAQNGKRRAADPRALLKKPIAELVALTTTVPLCEVCARLGTHVGLLPLESELVAFAVVSQVSRALGDVIRLFDIRTPRELADVVGAALCRRRADVERVLLPSALAIQTGLLWFDLGPFTDRGAPLRVTWQLEDALLSPALDDDELLAVLVQREPRASLGDADFTHLARSFSCAVALIRGAVAQQSAGVHVLLSGPPGTGKTELARLIFERAEVEAFSVPSVDGADSVQGAARLKRYALAQRLLRLRPRSGLIFDELEDGIPRMNGEGAKKESKAFLHSLFEQDPLPAIFITNDPEALDPSVVRRFDLVIDMGVPNEQTRHRIAVEALAPVGASPSLVARLSADARLAPAIVTRAARGVRLANVEGDDAIATFLDGTLDALGGAGVPGPAEALLPYDPALAACSVDVVTLAARMAERRRGALLISGPSGVGRRALAEHLARRAALHVMHTSWPALCADSSRIATAFRNVRRREVLLLIDEAGEAIVPAASSSSSRHAVVSLLEQLAALPSATGPGAVVLVADEPAVVDTAMAAYFDVRVTLARPGASLRAMLARAALASLGVSLDDDGSLRAARLDGVIHADIVAALRRTRFLLDGEHDDDARTAFFFDALAAVRGTERAIGFLSNGPSTAAPFYARR
jgi:transitional endoplasmic reticulum ATPase